VFVMSRLHVSDDDLVLRPWKAADVESGPMSSPGSETMRAAPEEK
jgi:hypothetical protein